MGVQIDSGITIGPGITISPPPSAIRTLLSPAGQTSYDATANDGWFSVSSTDYGNVRTGLTGITTVGYTDTQLTNATSGFSRNFGATLNTANATVTTGNYILGLVSRGQGSGTLIFQPYSSTTFKGSYSVIGTGNLTISQIATPTYWLRKNPSSAVPVDTYVAVGVPNGGTTLSWGYALGTTWGAGATGGGYSGTMTTWTDFNSGLPAQQWLLTNTAQW